jgi:aspartate-semialdehyde dehydrogenase
MNPSTANNEKKIALLGASTLEGTRVRQALEAARIASKRVDLYGHSEGEVLLSEYAGEARMIQEPDPGEIAAHAAVLVCEAGESTLRVAESLGSDQVVIDLVGGLPDSVGAQLVNPHKPASEALAGFYAVPHSLALVLSDLLSPIDRGPGVEQCVAVVVRPAVDYGEAGVEELREQTVRLLNCVELPVATFGRQLAFNIIPESGLSCSVPGLESEIARQVAVLLGWDRERLTLRFLAAPLFYGHAVELHLRTPNGAGLEDLRRALSENGLEPGEQRGPLVSTPMEVANERTIRLGELSNDGLGGFWLWAVAGGSNSRAAEFAVDLAKRAIQ